MKKLIIKEKGEEEVIYVESNEGFFLELETFDYESIFTAKFYSKDHFKEFSKKRDIYYPSDLSDNDMESSYCFDPNSTVFITTFSGSKAYFESIKDYKEFVKRMKKIKENFNREKKREEQFDKRLKLIFNYKTICTFMLITTLLTLINVTNMAFSNCSH